MSLDSDISLWKQLTAAIGTTAAGLFGYHKYLDAKIARKADNDAVKEAIHEIRTDMQWQRENIAKVFDQIRESDQRTQDKFDRIMERL